MLAGEFFDVVRNAFEQAGPVTVRFERVDDLVDAAIAEEHLVATGLLCAQLLHRVTARPLVHPRHVQTLTDITLRILSSPSLRTMASAAPRTTDRTKSETVRLR